MENAEVVASPPRHRMSSRQRLLFFVTAWLIVLMPFLFWWNTWFGRHLTPKQMTEYLRDEQHPRHIQHALIQMGERMSQRDAAVKFYYPELIRLAKNPVEEVRNTDGWVMGQDTQGVGFHEALLAMLNDPSPMVRGNAALSLVRFGDATGRPQIVALLQPSTVTAPSSGVIGDASKPGTAIHQGGLVAKITNGGESTEVRSPIPGRIQSLFVGTGHKVGVNEPVAVIQPETEQVWDALRALYVVGQLEDLEFVEPYERELREIPDRVRQQAKATANAIRERAQRQ